MLETGLQTRGAPLAGSWRAPGPTESALPGCTSELSRDPLGFLLAARAHYGDVIRFRFLPWPTYLISHPDHVQYVLHEARGIYSRESCDARMLRPVLGHRLAAWGDGLWRRQRRLMESGRAAAFGPLVVERSLAMCARWESHLGTGQPIQVASEMRRLVIEVASGAFLGVSPGRQQAVGEAVVTLFRSLGDQWSSPPFLPRPCPLPVTREVEQAIRTLESILPECAAWRGDRRDVSGGGALASQLRAKSERQRREELLTLLLTGHATTAGALTWTWWLLSRHAEVARRVDAEVARVLGSRPPTVDDLKRLSYTRMVLDEALRLFPSAWVFSRSPIRDDEIGGYQVPARSLVLVSPWVTHRHPDVWRDPDVFRPERFRDEESTARPRFSYLPFGTGPRSGEGTGFAVIEALLVLATVMQRYRLRALPDHDAVPEPSITLRPRDGLPMVVERRGAGCA
jgi:cytochrome P450